MTLLQSLRPFQRDVFQRMREGAHLVCIAPTGSGKSRIYETWIAENPSERLVLITPLVALSRQHVQTLRAQGQSVWFATEERGQDPRVIEQCRVWVLSPEHLESAGLRARVAAWKPALWVFDECHSYWEWGQGFRPKMGEMLRGVSALGLRQSLWLSATLTRESLDWIQKETALTFEVTGTFSVPAALKIKSHCLPFSARLVWMRKWLLSKKSKKSGGICFVWSRQWCEKLANIFAQYGFRCVFYHAGMTREEKTAIEVGLRERQYDVVFATSAFGMGMDFGMLDWVVIWQVPPTMMALAQAIGRVGRNKKSGEAVLLWEERDFEWLRSRAGQDPEAMQNLRKVEEWYWKEGDRRAALAQSFR